MVNNAVHNRRTGAVHGDSRKLGIRYMGNPRGCGSYHFWPLALILSSLPKAKPFSKAGLFSVTVINFIIQSYQLLSPDSVDEAKAFFTQISQQLVDISNGMPIQNVEAHGIAPFKPTASAIRINVLLLLSLFLNLTCVVFAGAIQQRARGHMKLAPCPHNRARMHVDALSDTKRSQMSRAIETTTTLLHLSVFLFFVGLVEFLFHINKTIAFYALIYISAATFVYMALTALPYCKSH
jgi:Family of unknown function (DUF6535)